MLDGRGREPEAQIRLMLMAHGITVAHPDDDELVRAAELREASDAHPGPEHPVTQRCPSPTLSLADAMILAICELLTVEVAGGQAALGSPPVLVRIGERLCRNFLAARRSSRRQPSGGGGGI